jgi:HPt (histidine-containing phosphotransfer) domain-containing protein
MDEPIDHSTLSRLKSDIGDDQFTELIGEYIADAGNLVDAINGAVSRRESEAVMRGAHTLKSTSRVLGAAELAELCAALELAGREDDLSGADELAARATDVFGAVKQALQRLL